MMSVLISKDAKVVKGELRYDKLLLVTRKTGDFEMEVFFVLVFLM